MVARTRASQPASPARLIPPDIQDELLRVTLARVDFERKVRFRIMDLPARQLLSLARQVVTRESALSTVWDQASARSRGHASRTGFYRFAHRLRDTHARTTIEYLAALQAAREQRSASQTAQKTGMSARNRRARIGDSEP